MTNKEKVACLKQYKILEKEIVENENRYAVLHSRLTSPSISKITDMPRGGSPNKDKICDGIAQLEELMHDRLYRLVGLQKDIETAIDNLSDSNHRRIMSARYVDGKSFEKIAADMCYSWQHIHRIHSEALAVIKIKMRKNESK
jgi:DNA-directed RNA polymerase specialized sigma subunit